MDRARGAGPRTAGSRRRRRGPALALLALSAACGGAEPAAGPQRSGGTGEPAEPGAPGAPAATAELVRREVHDEETPLGWNMEAALAQLGVHGEPSPDPPAATSPDGRWVASCAPAGEGWRAISIRPAADAGTAPVAPLSIGAVRAEEPGDWYGFRWSSDSRALLLFGNAVLFGHGRDLPHAFDVERERLLFLTPWYVFACTDGPERWRSGDPHQRGLGLPCVDPLAWDSAAEARAWLGPPDAEDADGTLRFGFALDDGFGRYAGEYELLVAVDAERDLVRGARVRRR